VSLVPCMMQRDRGGRSLRIDLMSVLCNVSRLHGFRRCLSINQSINQSSIEDKRGGGVQFSMHACVYVLLSSGPCICCARRRHGHPLLFPQLTPSLVKCCARCWKAKSCSVGFASFCAESESPATAFNTIACEPRRGRDMTFFVGA
jgi:hypothetical protein